jgi:hypothetical protein
VRKERGMWAVERRLASADEKREPSAGERPRQHEAGARPRGLGAWPTRIPRLADPVRRQLTLLGWRGWTRGGHRAGRVAKKKQGDGDGNRRRGSRACGAPHLGPRHGDSSGHRDRNPGQGGCDPVHRGSHGVKRGMRGREGGGFGGGSEAKRTRVCLPTRPAARSRSPANPLRSLPSAALSTHPSEGRIRRRRREERG